MRDAACNESQPSAPAVACTRPDIDIVPDGRIDALDLQKTLQHWCEEGCCGAELCQFTDLDANGRIDFGDYAILALNWLATLGPETIELTFAPTDDVYLQDGTRYDSQQLRIQPSGPTRVAYLRFDVVGIPPGYSVRSVKVQLTENGDTGNGTLRFFRGSDNSWTEEAITSGSAPETEDQVGVRSGSVGGNQTISVDITPLVLANGAHTVIVKMDAGGNDIWFGSKESSRDPRLTIIADRDN